MHVEAQNDLGWIADLARRSRARFVWIARREGLSEDDAVEVVHDAYARFLALPLSRTMSADPERAARYVASMVRNAARNRRRRHHLSRDHDSDSSALQTVPSDARSPEQLLSDAEAYQRLSGCIRELGPQQQQVVQLRLVDELPGREAAAQLGVTPNYINVLLHRARRQLSACMEQAGG